MKQHLISGVIAAAAVVSFWSAGMRAQTETARSSLRDSLPERWMYVPDHLQTAPVDDQWWRNFGDSTLNRLIREATENNFNVASALKRIEIAQRQVSAARAGYYPTLGVSAGWQKSQQAGAIERPAGPSVKSDYFSAGLQMNWEIDVFGRVRSKVKAGKAGVAVSRAEYDALLVSLCAEVADNYIRLRTYQQQYQVALTHIASQEKILRITEARLEVGIGDALEGAQAKIVLFSTKSDIPRLESLT